MGRILSDRAFAFGRAGARLAASRFNRLRFPNSIPLVVEVCVRVALVKVFKEWAVLFRNVLHSLLKFIIVEAYGALANAAFMLAH